MPLPETQWWEEKLISFMFEDETNNKLFKALSLLMSFSVTMYYFCIVRVYVRSLLKMIQPESSSYHIKSSLMHLRSFSLSLFYSVSPEDNIKYKAIISASAITTTCYQPTVHRKRSNKWKANEAKLVQGLQAGQLPKRFNMAMWTLITERNEMKSFILWIPLLKNYYFAEEFLDFPRTLRSLINLNTTTHFLCLSRSTIVERGFCHMN